MRKGRIIPVGRAQAWPMNSKRSSLFFPLTCSMGADQRSKHIYKVLVLYHRLVEEIAFNQTKERADMKSICRVPMSYGGR